MTGRSSRSHASSGPTGAASPQGTTSPGRPSRRRFLAAAGTAALAVGAGCVGGDDEARYERREVNETGDDPRDAQEMVAAEALAQTTADPSASHLGTLRLDAHEFTVADGFKGPVVTGEATNTGDGRLSAVEVRVRLYDDGGAQLGRYLDSTGDLDAGATWRFEVVLLASPSDVAAYDVAVLGIPA